MKRLRRFLFLMIVASLPGCVTVQKEPDVRSLAALKQRMFNVPKKDAFASIMAVLQDFGYEIVRTDITTGFIRGKTGWTTGDGVWIPGVKHSKSVTAFVDERDAERTSVRLNIFVDGVNVLDENAYEEVFDEISAEILLRQDAL